jgi:hypothetical protein
VWPARTPSGTFSFEPCDSRAASGPSVRGPAEAAICSYVTPMSFVRRSVRVRGRSHRPPPRVEVSAQKIGFFKRHCLTACNIPTCRAHSGDHNALWYTVRVILLETLHACNCDFFFRSCTTPKLGELCRGVAPKDAPRGSLGCTCCDVLWGDVLLLAEPKLVVRARRSLTIPYVTIPRPARHMTHNYDARPRGGRSVSRPVPSNWKPRNIICEILNP